MLLTQWHIRLIKRLLFLLIPYSLLRIGFYFYHLNIYRQFTQGDIFSSFLIGIRFDVAAICLINIPIILLALFPSNNQKFLKFERVQFTLINTTGFILSLDDYELFLFMGKRLSFDIFAVAGDILAQLPQMFVYYWYFPIGAIALGYGVYFFDKRFFALKGESSIKGWKQVVGGTFVLGLSFVGIRGGFQHKSINVQSAFVQGKNELGHLVLNTPYHFIRTLKNRSIERIRYFSTDDEAKNVILNARDFSRGYQSPKKMNVILIILESFSLEYVEKGYAPFLKSLINKSLYLDKHLANGRRSIEVLPSVLCGLPSLIDDPISKSIFSSNKFVCMPKLLKEAGYTNYFFHAGSRGTMGFEAYTLANGFDKYFSKEDYPGEEYDGSWGIYDGPYLKYVSNEISKMPEPFLAGVFTLSSHQPYAIPENMKGRFNKGTLEIHESIGYTDFALREFFEASKKKEWFNNTIFVITADHTQKLETKKFLNLVGHYRVPLVIYNSEIKFPTIDKVTQHADIPNTVLDMVGISSEGLPLLSSSIFSQDKGLAINYANGSEYFMIQGETLYKIQKNGESGTFHYSWETGEMTALTPSEDLRLKANLQYFINGLLKNNLSL